MPLALRLVALNPKALGIWYDPPRIAHRDLLRPERTAGVAVVEILVSPSPDYSREFVTKPPRRHARRARGAAREGGILETVC